MSIAEWYLALSALATGIAIGGYWLAATAFEVVPLPAMGARALEMHIVAEYVTAAALIAAGIARLTTDAAWLDPLNGIALGLLGYAMIGSVAFYQGRLMRAVFIAGTVATALALALLFVA